MTIGQGVSARVGQATPGLGGSASADVNSIIEWRVPQLSPDEEIVWMPASGFFSSFDAPARARVTNVTRQRVLLVATEDVPWAVRDLDASSGDLIRLEFEGSAAASLSSDLAGSVGQSASLTNRFRILDRSRPITGVPAIGLDPVAFTSTGVVRRGLGPGGLDFERNQFDTLPFSVTETAAVGDSVAIVTREARDTGLVPLELDFDIRLQPAQRSDDAQAWTVVGWVANHELPSVLEGQLDYELSEGMELRWRVEVNGRDEPGAGPLEVSGSLIAGAGGESGTLELSETFVLARGVRYEVAVQIDLENPFDREPGFSEFSTLSGPLRIRFVPEPGVLCFTVLGLLALARRRA